ncbi:hypothetical protein QQ008_00215 [Fulvivirgaceae bacterium BMA10]|uniref:Uncharacterized protein n=1 Tax=Splendidivirga corallicola TaxID=3051826 RepID=A0ABT8KGB4_9BACT|nr:hypothetical protein [Fulvivirgaceae bacterium BMA10]
MRRPCRKLFINSCFRLLMTGYAVLFFSSANAQSLNKNWKTELEQALTDYKKCKNETGDNPQKCSNVTGEVLKIVYNLNDFYSSQRSRYMVAKEIAEFLEDNTEWQLLGHAYEQDALEKAQELANTKRAVVAVLPDKGDAGHVSVILPGELASSGTWGFKVPNSTSFFVHDPQNSYVGKALSYAFTRNMIKDVLLFARSY